MVYLAYHESDYNEGKTVPIAAGNTEEEARSLGIRTILGLGWTDGGLRIVPHEGLSKNDAKSINDVMAKFLRSRGPKHD